MFWVLWFQSEVGYCSCPELPIPRTLQFSPHAGAGVNFVKILELTDPGTTRVPMKVNTAKLNSLHSLIFNSSVPFFRAAVPFCPWPRCLSSGSHVSHGSMYHTVQWSQFNSQSSHHHLCVPKAGLGLVHCRHSASIIKWITGWMDG